MLYGPSFSVQCGKTVPTAKDAALNTYRRQHDQSCLPHTRVNLLNEICDWCDGRDGRCIFWLNGLAGTGNSTIVRTVARRYLEQRRLGASFFFSRGGGDVGHAGDFITSIAVRYAVLWGTMCLWKSTFAIAVAAALVNARLCR
jgi:hypothetical protein